MIIIKIMGGLGNQMFQYALGLSFEVQGVEVKYDTSFFGDDSTDATRRDYSLDIFSNNIEYANGKDIERLYDYNKLINVLGRKILRINLSKTILEDEKRFMPEIINKDNRYLIGYWQDEKYFIGLESYIKEKLKFDPLNPKINSEIVESLSKNNDAVSVHIRGTDYLKFNDIYGNICTENYYMQAIQQITQRIPNSYFYIFSDDYDYAYKIVKELNIDDRSEFIKGFNGKDSWIDMYYMSLCRHHIIANSSFSWWGAWLGEHDNSIVIGPKKWNNNQQSNRVMPDRWMRV